MKISRTVLKFHGGHNILNGLDSGQEFVTDKLSRTALYLLTLYSLGMPFAKRADPDQAALVRAS